MKTSTDSLQSCRTKKCLGIMAVVGIMAIFSLSPAQADIPSAKAVPLQGMYQVSASNDPIFPMGGAKEWFLDFGDGMQNGEYSGKVAVSLRENPSVRVRIMVWQYFPNEKALLIGNQFEEGSGQAVAQGVWTLGNDAGEMILLRDRCSIILKKADPYDY